MATGIIIENRRKKAATLLSQHPGAVIIDVTSKGPQPWIRFSPFFPHGNIPVPFSPGQIGQSVEGIWQGLKVFESTGIDTATLAISSMKGIKRTSRRFGRVLGHQKGVAASELLDYRTARKQIYLPVYKYALDTFLQAELSELRWVHEKSTLILLDYETNTDPDDLSRPLSHAGLVRFYLEGRWPE
jgi:hypothetical protein